MVTGFSNTLRVWPKAATFPKFMTDAIYMPRSKCPERTWFHFSWCLVVHAPETDAGKRVWMVSPLPCFPLYSFIVMDIRRLMIGPIQIATKASFEPPAWMVVPWTAVWPCVMITISGREACTHCIQTVTSSTPCKGVLYGIAFRLSPDAKVGIFSIGRFSTPVHQFNSK